MAKPVDERQAGPEGASQARSEDNTFSGTKRTSLFLHQLVLVAAIVTLSCLTLGTLGTEGPLGQVAETVLPATVPSVPTEGRLGR